MRNWAKWRAEASARSERARRAAMARWDAECAARHDEPCRTSRVIEMVVRDSHRPMRLIRLEADDKGRAWSRWKVTENGARVGRRRFGRTAIARLIAYSLD